MSRYITSIGKVKRSGAVSSVIYRHFTVFPVVTWVPFGSWNKSLNISKSFYVYLHKNITKAAEWLQHINKYWTLNYRLVWQILENAWSGRSEILTVSGEITLRAPELQGWGLWARGSGLRGWGGSSEGLWAGGSGLRVRGLGSGGLWAGGPGLRVWELWGAGSSGGLGAGSCWLNASNACKQRLNSIAQF